MMVESGRVRVGLRCGLVLSSIMSLVVRRAQRRRRPESITPSVRSNFQSFVTAAAASSSAVPERPRTTAAIDRANTASWGERDAARREVVDLSGRSTHIHVQIVTNTHIGHDRYACKTSRRSERMLSADCGRPLFSCLWIAFHSPLIDLPLSCSSPSRLP